MANSENGRLEKGRTNLNCSSVFPHENDIRNFKMIVNRMIVNRKQNKETVMMICIATKKGSMNHLAVKKWMDDRKEKETNKMICIATKKVQ